MLDDLLKQWRDEADAADEEKERAARQQPNTPGENPEATAAYLVAAERAYLSRKHADELERLVGGAMTAPAGQSVGHTH